MSCQFLGHIYSFLAKQLRLKFVILEFASNISSDFLVEEVWHLYRLTSSTLLSNYSILKWCTECSPYISILESIHLVALFLARF